MARIAASSSTTNTCGDERVRARRGDGDESGGFGGSWDMCAGLEGSP
jgi:hypothetical protein